MALPETPFTITFYESADGRSPVDEFLAELKRTDPDDYASVAASLARLRDRKCHKEPLTKKLDADLYELRHVGKLNTRVFWFFRRGRRIIAVHGVRNKGQKINSADIETARRRIADWKRRHPDESH